MFEDLVLFRTTDRVLSQVPQLFVAGAVNFFRRYERVGRACFAMPRISPWFVENGLKRTSKFAGFLQCLKLYEKKGDALVGISFS